MSPDLFDRGLEELRLAVSASTAVPASVRLYWLRHLGALDERVWREAIRILSDSVEIFPRNLVKAVHNVLPEARRNLGMLSQVIDPISPDTGLPWSAEETRRNRRRLEALGEVVLGDTPARSAVLGCALASQRASDTPEALREWGGRIEELLDGVLSRVSVGNAGAPV